MIDSKFAAAIVGFGGMGNWHGEILKDFDDLFCAGVYDIDPARLEYAGGLGLKAYGSLDEVLKDPGIDIVVIATPNDLHKEIALKAMRSGKNIVCEKPVTLSSADLREMIDCANECNVLFTVHQNRRWDEDYLTMKNIFESKTLGDVFNIESRVHGSRGIPGDWRGRKSQGGGMVLDWGVHILDQLLQMIPGKVKTVYGRMNHVTNYEVDDGFRIIMTFESGITALAEVGTSNFISLPRWYMQGENGTAVIEDFSCKGKIVSITNWDLKDAVPVKTAAGLTKTMAPRTEETIKESVLPEIKSDIHDFYRNVVGTISGKSTSLIKHEELMRCMKLMEAAFRSDESGQIVDFE
ncbi:MAG: Gfo/Idh/MocA family oxidoreductase [Eubacteriales bacterium]|nr:Gfo/Idh/MocA family oxidoreductase [Eubacteriales bacterium]MDD4716669.1 Gfo/Idh/MocA family oxidoreductase [Eubacteriales bacterium]